MTSKLKLVSKILSDGYCCTYGYIQLCRARGQNSASMSKGIDSPTRTIEYHITQVKRGKAVCQKRADCLKGVFEEKSEDQLPSPGSGSPI